MTYLLNCTNCAWHTYVEGSMIEADFQRDCHETSLRNALVIGPFCPRRSVVIRPVRDGGAGA